MEKLNEIRKSITNIPNGLIKNIKKRRTQKKRKKLLKRIKKGLKAIVKKETIVKIILVLATASLLLPLILPFID